MDPKRDRVAGELFERVRKLPESARRAILDRDCADDPDLRAIVTRLLADAETIAGTPTPFDISELSTAMQAAPSSSVRPHASLRAGQPFGDFRLERLLGTGGFAQVWEAEDRDGRRVALKVLDQVNSSRKAIERFEREGRLAASLNHPRSVYVFGAFEIAGHPTIAMEVVPAGSLEDRLREHGALPPQEAVDRILEILEGLEAAHRLGIIHRDVKPSNCFLDADGRAKIGDFGISRSLDLDSGLTATGVFLGTPSYASPEQIRGEDLDARSDLYSVGAMLYSLLSGRLPFEGQNAGMVFSKILTERPRRFSEPGVRIPRGLERAVLRLMEKDPGKRYRDSASARAALLPFSSQGLTFVGIAGRPGAFLLDAVLQSAVFALVCTIADESYLALSQNPTLRFLGADLLIGIVWFTTFETLWAGTPFKRLMGFRVMGSDGQRATFRSVVIRNVVFHLGMGLLFIVGVAMGAGGKARTLMALLGYAVVLCPMRSSNRFAGLHELASGTRVMKVRKVASRREPEMTVGSLPLDEAPAIESLRGRLGPYHVEGRIASYGDGELLLGRDDALGRPVWIRTHSGRPTNPWDVNRPGRLRRLLRGEEEGKSWEAFEALDGVELRRRVAARGRLSWEEMRRMLPTLVEELRTGGEQGGLPERISLDHLWVDASGELRLLDFPLRRHASVEASENVAASDWGVLLHQLLLLGLEGRLVRLADLQGQIPRLPLPEHARAIVGRVCDRLEGEPSPATLHDELLDSGTKPARVTRRKRGMTLAMSALPLLFPALVMAVIVSSGHAHGGVAHLTWKFGLGFLIGVGVGMAFGVLPAFVMTFVFRGGLWMGYSGIRVQTADGKRASRLRCLLRGLIVYSPALLTLPLVFPIFARLYDIQAPQRGGLTHMGSSFSVGHTIGAELGSVTRSDVGRLIFPISGALFIVGAVWSLVRPERGFADLVAGTYLVPR